MLPALFSGLAAPKPVRGRRPFLSVTETAQENSIVLDSDEIWIIDQILCGYTEDTESGTLEILFDDVVVLSVPVPRGGPLPLYFPTGLSPETVVPVEIRLSSGISHLFVQVF